MKNTLSRKTKKEKKREVHKREKKYTIHDGVTYSKVQKKYGKIHIYILIGMLLLVISFMIFKLNR
jgi:hypothetical protein